MQPESWKQIFTNGFWHKPNWAELDSRRTSEKSRHSLPRMPRVGFGPDSAGGRRAAVRQQPPGGYLCPLKNRFHLLAAKSAQGLRLHVAERGDLEHQRGHRLIVGRFRNDPQLIVAECPDGLGKLY